MSLEKPHLNIVAIGHVDTGKSTTIGHLLYKCGAIDRRTIEKYEKEGAAIGKSSYKYAWVVDKLKAERSKGLTIQATAAQLETAKYRFTLINVPGHKDYLKNLITGTSEADIALLFVSASLGEFEASTHRDGQTPEHLVIAHTLGIKQVIVCVNKMDEKSVNYSQQRFEEVKQKVETAALNAGYTADNLTFVPLSAWLGENLLERSSYLSWWKGDSLLFTLDSAVVPPVRLVDKPLRVPIRDVYNIGGVGTVVVGTVATGVLKSNTSVTLAPVSLQTNVSTIETHHQKLEIAAPGDYVGLKVDLPAKDIRRGFVASDSNNKPAKECEYFTAQVVILHHPAEIRPGYCPVIDCHTAHVACKWKEILSKIDKNSGSVLEESPKSLKQGDAAIVNMYPQKSICVETLEDFAPLGRFVVRDIKKIIAVGIIKSVVEKK